MIFQPFCRQTCFELNQYSDNYFDKHHSNEYSDESCVYLYNINEGNCQSIGMLGAIRLNTCGDHIYMHERVNQSKVDTYAQKFLESSTQLSPIMITTPTPIILSSLPDPNNCNILYKSNDNKHSLLLVKKSINNLLSSQINLIDKFYILDGHHRISALQYIGADFALAILITKQYVNIGIMSRQLSFRNTKCKKALLDAIMKDKLFNVTFYEKFLYNSDQDSFVICSSKGSYLVSTTKKLSNFRLYDYIDNLVNQCSTVIDKIDWFQQKHESCLKNFSRLKNDSLLIQLPTMSYDQFIELISQKKKVGLHTTCFYPKPMDGFIKFKLCKQGSLL